MTEEDSIAVQNINNNVAALENFANSERMSNKSYKRNRKLMEQQNAYNLANWERQNEYNLPVNQLKRLRETGLNPYAFMEGAGNGQSINGVGLASSEVFDPQVGAITSQLYPQAMSAFSASQSAKANEIDNEYRDALNDLKRQYERHQVSKAAYDADLQMMARNKAVFTFADDMLTTFLSRDYIDRKLKNDTAIEIQRGSALEDALGLVMTENRGWSDDQNPSDFGYMAFGGGRMTDQPDFERKSTNNYYNFLYRGSKDKNNPIYQSFLQDYKNLETRAILESYPVDVAHTLKDNLSMAELLESSNRLAEVQLDHSMRNGFKDFDPNMLLYRGLRDIESLFLGGKLHTPRFLMRDGKSTSREVPSLQNLRKNKDGSYEWY